ncbi:response regulator transcription factor [Pseudonocardia lacus]|uniref:response regulator transcription factor n=1 Tax=Pseudonocardia lacus TaxID=2835865 RepID=UPI001BDCD44A|nr:response regulator transcription factor [Pseudonocardia lacus]
MRVALADDSGILRMGLTRLLEAAGIDVRYAARDGDDLLRFMAVEQPDAVIVDIRMPPGFADEGLGVAETIKQRHPGVGVLVLSTYGETSYAMRLMAIGVPGVGYLLKDRVDDVDALRDALRRVAAGKPAIDPEIVAALFTRPASQSSLDVLAPREREVLRHMAEGRSNQGIATIIGVTTRTVEGYAASIFTKLRLPDSGDDNRRVHAVLAWLRDAHLGG